MEVTRTSRFSHLKATNGYQPAGLGRPTFVYIHVSCKGWGLSVHTDKAEPCRCLRLLEKCWLSLYGEWFVWALAGARRLWLLRMVHVLAAEYGPPKETCGKTSDERSRGQASSRGRHAEYVSLSSDVGAKLPRRVT